MEIKKTDTGFVQALRALADSVENGQSTDELLAEVCRGMAQNYSDAERDSTTLALITSVLGKAAEAMSIPQSNENEISKKAMEIANCVADYYSAQYKKYNAISAGEKGGSSLADQLRFADEEVAKLQESVKKEEKKLKTDEEELANLEAERKRIIAEQEKKWVEIYNMVEAVLDEIENEGQGDINPRLKALQDRVTSLYEAQSEGEISILERLRTALKSLENLSHKDSGMDAIQAIGEGIKGLQTRCDALLDEARRHDGILTRYKTMFRSLDELEASFKNLIDSDSRIEIDACVRVIMDNLNLYERQVSKCIETLSREYREIWTKANGQN